VRLTQDWRGCRADAGSLTELTKPCGLFARMTTIPPVRISPARANLLFGSIPRPPANSMMKLCRKKAPRTALFCSMCVPHFWCMKITEDVRKYAAEHNISEMDAIESGLQENSKEFTPAGAELYGRR